jgi:hypothetical protein
VRTEQKKVVQQLQQELTVAGGSIYTPPKIYSFRFILNY